MSLAALKCRCTHWVGLHFWGCEKKSGAGGCWTCRFFSGRPGGSVAGQGVCVCVCLVAVGTTRSESQVRCSSSAGLGFRHALAAAEDLCHCKGTRKFVTNQPGLSFSSLVIVLNEGWTDRTENTKAFSQFSFGRCFKKIPRWSIFRSVRSHHLGCICCNSGRNWSQKSINHIWQKSGVFLWYSNAEHCKTDGYCFSGTKSLK